MLTVRGGSAKAPGPRVLRLLDANLNRCKEGLRVLEDTARFIWGSSDFFRAFRRERHRLRAATEAMAPELVRARNSERDEGRSLREGPRRGVEDVVRANFRRCEESVRVLEEYGKIFSAAAGRNFKRMRFRLYDLEKKFMVRSKRSPR